MKYSKEKGITLIALVITIIVLLILAGVSIAMLTGENGILTQAQGAKNETERAKVIEEVQTAIMGKQAEEGTANLDKTHLKEILDNYFEPVPDDFTKDTELQTLDEYGDYQILVSEVYAGDLEEPKEMISKETSYVGNYADIDGDGIVDGIIYADQAVGGSGEWGSNGWGAYEIPKVESGLKEYSISETGYAGPFGTKNVLKAEKNGTERFYVMALNDIDNQTHYWYYNASGLDNIVSSSTNDFGQGKTNTTTMISKWNNSAYGAQNSNDMWGLIQDQVNEGWFVPSKTEWGVFAGALGINTSNYPEYGLSYNYWSSSQYDNKYAYYASLENVWIMGCVNNFYTFSVRLSTTF